MISSMRPVAGLRHRPAFSPAPSGLLQRKCACGKHAAAGGECSECSRKKRLGLQPKLRMGAPGDAYEQEADRMADEVMAGQLRPGARDPAPRLQRFPEGSAAAPEAVPPSVDQTLSTPGRPLEAGLRREMEGRFGHDFSRVMVHSDALAGQSARDANAQAYTVGHHMVFGAGRFSPGTQEGRRLLAHELSHVVQQSGTVSPRVQRAPLAGGFPRGTNLRFDTYQITERDLADPDIQARLRRLTPDQLRVYLDRVSDPAVKDFINKRLATSGSAQPPTDPVEDCLFGNASLERVAKIVGPQLDVFECYGALEDRAAKFMLTPEAGCMQCLHGATGMGLDEAHTICRDRLLNNCIEITKSWKRFVRKPF